MPTFSYTALGGTLRSRRGSVEAPTIKEARERLRKQGVLVTGLRLSTRPVRRKRLTRDALINFTAQLAQLVRSGLPLYESLLALEEQYRSESFHRVLVQICEEIRGGKSLSHALEAHPHCFPTLYVALVAAGESSGTLDSVLLKLTGLLKKQAKIRKGLISALTYPALVGAFCVVVIALLLTFALPSMEGLLEGHHLGTFTRCVFGISHFLRGWYLLYLPLLGACVAALLYALRSKKMRPVADRLLLRTPLIKTLLVQAAFARFSETLATLQSGGVNMIEALRLSQRVMGNEELEQVVERSCEKIIAGSSLAKEFASEPLVPRLIARMVRVGEESGEMMPMLMHIGELYADELEKTLSRLTAAIQPVILIVMGGIIGVIMLAVLLPLTDMSSFM